MVYDAGQNTPRMLVDMKPIKCSIKRNGPRVVTSAHHFKPSHCVNNGLGLRFLLSAKPSPKFNWGTLSAKNARQATPSAMAFLGFSHHK